jgi:hypothetical protein
VEVELLLVVYQHVVDGFEADRPEAVDDLLRVRSRLADVGVRNHHEGAVEQRRRQQQRRLQRGGAGALGSDERPGDVEPLLGEQLVEVVTRYAARERGDVGEPGTDRVGVAVAQVSELGVDLTLAAAGGDDPRQIGLLVHAHPEALAVVSAHLHR